MAVGVGGDIMLVSITSSPSDQGGDAAAMATVDGAVPASRYMLLCVDVVVLLGRDRETSFFWYFCLFIYL